MATRRGGIDGRDLRILAILQAEGRITNAELALRVGLSPSPCLERVRRLERQGYIRGYGARLDPARLGPHVLVLVEITLAHHRGDDFQRFEQHVRRLPEVLEAYTVSGAFDYLLKVVCPDMTAYQGFSDALLEAPIGIAKLNSHVVLKTLKGFEGHPVERLVDPGRT